MGVVLLALLYEYSIGGGVSLVNTSKVMIFIATFIFLAPVAARVISLVLFFAWLAHTVGAPELLGGFAAGLALSRRFFLPLGIALRADPKFAHRIEDQMKPVIHLFTPIFFVMVGLSLNLREIDWGSGFIWIFSLSLFTVSVLGKFAGAFMIKESWQVRCMIGTAMVPRGDLV